MQRSIIIGIMIMLFMVPIYFWSLLTPAVAQAVEMGGVYSLGNFFSPSELSNPDITGLSLRARWEDIEPQKGVFDWSYLDENINKAIMNDKKIMIRVTAGIFTPDWVYSEGAEAITFEEDGAISTMPVPWDPIYLNCWTQFIRELGYRYGGLSQVVTIHMTGPCKTGEMYLPEKSDRTRWLSEGYTSTKLIKAWKTVIDAYDEAFPMTNLGINIALPVSFGGGTLTLETILKYAYNQLGHRLRVQGNWLSAKTSVKYSLYLLIKNYSNYTNVGFQMLCSANNIEFGGTLHQAINKGLAAGASYLEIYDNDIENPAYAKDIKYANYNLKLNER